MTTSWQESANQRRDERHGAECDDTVCRHKKRSKSRPWLLEATIHESSDTTLQWLHTWYLGKWRNLSRYCTQKQAEQAMAKYQRDAIYRGVIFRIRNEND